MSRKRDRQRLPARRPPFQDPKPVILIVCEGAVTEPQYLNGFRKACRNPRVEIEIRKGKGVPKSIVEFAKVQQKTAEKRAKKQKDENLIYDQVWSVFNIDQHPNIPGARQMARDNGIELAVSNPCFELWRWLHFADQPGQRDRREFPNMLKKHIPAYDKHIDYSDYAPGYETAVKRARKLDHEAALNNDGGRNLTTGIWRLTESIREGT